jgi:hypothetical protein
MKKALKLTGLVLGVAFVAIQFVRPERNLGEPEGPQSIVAVHAVPAEVREILRRSCYDCHSNRTAYPWYAEVQPVRWWLDSHISDGKRHLNFSEFGRYDADRARRKLDEIVDTVLARSMPLESYTWVHRDAVLSPDQMKLVADWAEALYDEIE